MVEFNFEVPKDLRKVPTFKAEWVNPRRYLLGLDIETTGLDRHRDDITLVQIGFFKGKRLKYLVFPWQRMSQEERISLIKEIAKVPLITHNGKFDLLFIYEKTGIELEIGHDTLVMAHVAGEDECGLKPLVVKHYGDDYDIEKEAKTGELSPKLVYYGVKDVWYTLRLYKFFAKKLKEDDLLYVYRYELRAYKAYYKVEQGGVPISPRRHEIKASLVEEYTPILEKLNSVARINWNSGDQVGLVFFSPKGTKLYGKPKKVAWVTVLDKETQEPLTDKTFKTKKEASEWAKAEGYRPKDIDVVKDMDIVEDFLGEGLGLTPLGYTDKGKPQTDTQSLMELALENEVAKWLVEYKKLTKLVTFIDSWEKLQVDGKIYPTFNILARTGRTTCSNPNLENAEG